MKENFKARVLWCIAFIFIGGGMYLLANSYGGLMGAFNIQLEFEKNIPFMPWTIIIYFLIFPYLALPVFLIERYKDFFKVVIGFWIITFVSAAVFFLFPTTMPRPEIIVENGLLKILFRAIYSVDGPHNLFPSLHVSTVSYIAFVLWRFYPKGRILSTLFAVLICLSTLTVKQHAVLDVLGGCFLGLTTFIVVFKVIFEKTHRNT